MPKIAVTVLFAALVAGCTVNTVAAPVAVQEATAGQDNREIVLPLAILGALTIWGIQ